MKKRFTLAEGGTATFYRRKNKCAFTLAEVLITLGIIGIVAALTIPSLIAKHQKQQTVTALKKFYSSLSQAIKLSELENGEAKNWDYSLSGENFYKLYIRPYFKVSQEAFNTSFEDKVSYKRLNGLDFAEVSFVDPTTPKFFLADGSLVALRTGNYVFSSNAMFYIDINGLKKPNVLGKDLFTFAITANEGKLVPYGLGSAGADESFTFGDELDRDKLKDTSKNYSCSADTWGFWCTALIMADGWEIKDDYPW